LDGPQEDECREFFERFADDAARLYGSKKRF
jgi:hypothetical protein